MTGVDLMRVGKFCVKVALTFSIFSCSFNAGADSMCIGSRSAEELSKIVHYAILEDIVRFDIDVDAEDQFHVVSGAEIYYGVPRSGESYDSIEDGGYVLQAPLKLEERGSKLQASVFTRRKFDRFVVVLILEPREGFENYCVQYELLNISRSQVDYSDRFGEVSLGG